MSATWIGLPSRFASSIARSLAVEISVRIPDANESRIRSLSRPARSVKKPRPWLDQAKFGICRATSHGFQSSLEAVNTAGPDRRQHFSKREMVGKRTGPLLAGPVRQDHRLVHALPGPVRTAERTANASGLHLPEFHRVDELLTGTSTLFWCISRCRHAVVCSRSSDCVNCLPITSG